jgi:hypothetical protein
MHRPNRFGLLMTAITLASPIALGKGRSLKPPQGWVVKGLVADDPLRLQPSSRLLIEPPDAGASISWRIASWLVGKPHEIADFELLLDSEHQLSEHEIAGLYPHLLRILPENVQQCSVRNLPECGRVLEVTYLLEEHGWAGHVIYAPTLEVEGEIQLLSYEGRELAYLMHFEEAMASMSTFQDERLASRG